MSYRFLRELFFMLPPEVAHDFSLRSLSFIERVGGVSLLAPPAQKQTAVRVMGIDFPNAVGLAAGLDKNAEHVTALSRLGFGFIEVGTVTPQPQPGNPKPRLFRLPEYNAIINRMGFNNAGIEQVLKNISTIRTNTILGINIGKNATTPVEEATNDYLSCLRQAYAHASYITVNLSSPNTTDLRSLQFGDVFSALLNCLKEEQQKLAQQYDRYVPLVVKIAPDLESDEITTLANTLIAHQIDGVIATNTTISRKGVEQHKLANEIGGLSGMPLFDKSTRVVSQLSAHLGGKLPIIASGGIMSTEDAVVKINAGASLVQLYTGFIYKGPQLIKDAVEVLNNQPTL